jgi:hypothetical protein
MLERAPKCKQRTQVGSSNTTDEMKMLRSMKRSKNQISMLNQPNSSDHDGTYQTNDVNIQITSPQESNENDQSIKRRNARNVGRWVTLPTTKIDRKWLTDSNVAGDFDPSFYVPQVGDTVLYVKEVCASLSLLRFVY